MRRVRRRMETRYMIRRAMACAFTLAVYMPAFAAGASKEAPVPDLTAGGKIDHKTAWTLGSTGARGWVYSDGRSTDRSRQIYITAVSDDSPAAGVLREGDVILGAQGNRWQELQRFTSDARKAVSEAVTDAEQVKNAGALRLLRWRAGKEDIVTLKLEVMGSFSDTAPFDCAKTDKIVDKTVAALL